MTVCQCGEERQCSQVIRNSRNVKLSEQPSWSCRLITRRHSCPIVNCKWQFASAERRDSVLKWQQIHEMSSCLRSLVIFVDLLHVDTLVPLSSVKWQFASAERRDSILKWQDVHEMSNCLSSPVRFVDLLHVDNIIQLSSVSDSLPARRREKVFSSDKRFTKCQAFWAALWFPLYILYGVQGHRYN